MWTLPQNRTLYDRSHLRYPSDVTDEKWGLIRVSNCAHQARRPQT